METAPVKKTSSLRVLLYIVLAIIALSFFLELTGIADIAGTREHDTMIDRPHDR